MNIQGAFRDVSQSIGNYCYAAQQATLSVVFKFKELRNDPDFFQKVCQVAFASLQLIMMNYSSTVARTRLSAIFFNTAGMHDFYRIIQYPRHLLFPVNAEVINEFNVLEDLTKCLENQDVFENLGEDDEISQEDINALSNVIEKCLEDQLELMIAHNDAYRSLDEFIGQIKKRLEAQDIEGFDFSEIDLSELNETNPEYNVSAWIRLVPTLEKITNLNWAVVDALTIAWWAKEWKFLDTAKLASNIGQYRALSWVQNHSLEYWLIGLVCTGFTWKLLEAARKLRDDALTTEEKRQARWNVVTSAAEIAFFGTIFMNIIGKTQINNAYVQLLAIGAKSLGLISIATRPRHQFFQHPEAAPTA